jgi:hypothetical protein
LYSAAKALLNSSLSCGLAVLNSQPLRGRVSLVLPPVKMSSPVVSSVERLEASAAAVLVAGFAVLSANTWSQSCEVVVDPDAPRTPVVALPSSSNVPRMLGVTRSSSGSSRREHRGEDGGRLDRAARFGVRLGGA